MEKTYTKEKKHGDTSLGVRPYVGDYELLKKAAKKTGRSVNGIVCELIKGFVRDKDGKPKKTFAGESI